MRLFRLYGKSRRREANKKMALVVSSRDRASRSRIAMRETENLLVATLIDVASPTKTAENPVC